jgi:hypothetical protein
MLYIILGVILLSMGGLAALCSIYSSPNRYYYMVCASMSIAGGIVCLNQ